MAKEEDKDKPKVWTPDQPLEDEEDEEKAHAISKARARTDYLYKQYTTPADPKGKKKKGFNPFGDQ